MQITGHNLNDLWSRGDGRKVRNMEHLGTFRNIPEHPGTTNNKRKENM